MATTFLTILRFGLRTGALLLVPALVAATQPTELIDEIADTYRRAHAIQQQLDGLYREAAVLRNRRELIEFEGTADALVLSGLRDAINTTTLQLEQRRADLQAVAATENGIVFLIQSMSDSLARFIELDLPFEVDARRSRARESTGLHLTGKSVTDGYQSISAAYLAEVAQGSSDAISTMAINSNGNVRIGDVLRLGRMGLWYVTPDNREAGRWDSTRRQWIVDGSTDPTDVRRAIRHVAGDAPASIVTLPVTMPVDVAQ